MGSQNNISSRNARYPSNRPPEGRSDESTSSRVAAGLKAGRKTGEDETSITA